MHPKSPKWLDDIRTSCAYIMEDTRGATPDDYLADRPMRQLVEHNLTIIGEALTRLRREDSETLARITDAQKIIALRHRLAHGYDEEIDNARVWQVIKEWIPILHNEVERLIPEFEP